MDAFGKLEAECLALRVLVQSLIAAIAQSSGNPAAQVEQFRELAKRGVANYNLIGDPAVTKKAREVATTTVDTILNGLTFKKS